MSINRSSVKGFTIVELLVVIIVVAILATVAIVSFNGMQERAYGTQALMAYDTFKKRTQLAVSLAWGQKSVLVRHSR